MTCDSSHVPYPAPAAGPASAASARPQEPARVAVIVPAYGVAHLLGEALTSLQRQTFTQWECVVIDDGAPDDVAGAVAPFLSDPRIRFLATANHGVSAARNTAIAASSAPLVALPPPLCSKRTAPPLVSTGWSAVRQLGSTAERSSRTGRAHRLPSALTLA